MAMSQIQLDIVTAERLVSSDKVEIIVVPGLDGELTILPRHSTLLTVLKPGEIRVTKGKEENHIAVSGGFLEVIGNKVTILADTAEREDEIDIQRAQEALNEAREQIKLAASSKDLEKALASMNRSRARMKVASRKRRASRLDVATH